MSTPLQFNSLTHIIDTILLSGGNLVARKRKDGGLSIALKIQRLTCFNSLLNILEIHLKRYGFKTNTSIIKKDKISTVLYVQVDPRLNEFYSDWYKINGYNKNNVVLLSNKIIPARNLIIDDNTLAVWYAACGGPHILKWNTKSNNKSRVSGGALYFPGGSIQDANKLINLLQTSLNLTCKLKLAHKNGKHGDYFYLKMDLDSFKRLITIVKPKLSKALAFKLDINNLQTVN